MIFSAQKEGVFEPTVAVEYTDDEVGFRSEEEALSRVVRDEVRLGLYGSSGSVMAEASAPVETEGSVKSVGVCCV